MSPAPGRPTLPRASPRFTIACTLSTPCSCWVMPIDHTSTAARAAAYIAREARHVGARRARRALELVERLALRARSSSASKPGRVRVDERAVDAADREQLLQHAVDERDVAAGVHREELVGRSSCRTSRSRRSTAPSSARGPGSRSGLTTAIFAPALLGEVQVLHEHGLGVGDVGAEQHDQVALDHVAVRARGGGRRRSTAFSAVVDGAWQTRAALSTLFVPMNARRLLRDVVHLVGDAARGEVERRRGRASSRGSGRRRGRAPRPTRRA